MLPEDFQTLAEELSQAPASPAKARSATSRAYYAVFLEVRDALNRLGVNFIAAPLKYEAHRHVADALSASGDPQLEGIGSGLATLRVQRNKADYDLHTVSCESEGTVTAHVQVAKRLLQDFQAHQISVEAQRAIRHWRANLR